MAGLNDPLTQLDYGVAYQRGPQSLTQQSGIAGLAAPAALDIARANQNALSDLADLGNLRLAPPPGQAAPSNQPVLAISRSTGQIWANGKLFTTDDAQGAIDSQQFLNGPPVPAPAKAAGDWEPLDIEAYSQHLEQIKNPGMGTLAAKNFGIGVDNMQMLGGYGLQFLGATETGQSVVQSQLNDLNKNAPYQRNFEDIGSDPNRGIMDWFIANLAQQGPNLVESAVTAAIGAAAGGAAGGGPNPATAVGGAVAAMVGKQAFKQSLLAAAKKYMAGEALDLAEQKLLREAAGITAAAVKAESERIGKDIVVDSAGNATRYTAEMATKTLLRPGAEAAAKGGLTQAKAGGAAIATGLQNYATGVSDLYGDSVEGGNPSRGYAAFGAVPYAALESLPEFIAAARIFGGVGASTKSLAGMSKLGKVGEVARRVGAGAAAGGALEGTTELGQETLGIGANDSVDLNSPEGLSRMLNAFAAGAAIGGFIGAGSNLNTGKPHDILSAGIKPADQGGQTILSGDVIPPTRPNGMQVPDGSVPLLGGPGSGAAALGGTTMSGSPFSGNQGSYYTGNPADDAALNPAGPIPMGAPTTPVAPTPGQPPVNMLPSASTIYQGQDPNARPPLALTGPAPVPPTGPAPASAAPAVINAPGPSAYGSALSQVAAGDLQQAAPPPSAGLNRLQQLQQQAKEQKLLATSQSALAQTARAEGGNPLTLKQMLGQKVEQSAPAPKGKAKLTKGRDKSGSKMQEVVDAAQVGKVTENNLKQREGTGGRLEKGRFNRVVAPQVQEAGNPPSRSNILKQGRAVQKTPAEVSATPVHDKFIAELDDARMNLATKKELRALTTRALKAGVLTQADLKEIEPMFKDRDMSADDIVPELTSMIDRNKEAAPVAETPKAEPKERKVPPEKMFSLKPKEDAKPAEAPSPKAEGAAAAPSQKAEKEAPKPSQALAIVDPNKPFVDPVVEARLKRQQQEAEETAALSQQDDMAEIEDLIVSVNTNDPDTVEYKDSLSALLEFVKDSKTEKKARARATEYIENEFDPDEIKLFERSVQNPVTQAELDFNTITTAMEQINNGEITLTQKLVGILVSAWKRIKGSKFKYGNHPLEDYIKGGPQFFHMKDGKVVPKGEGRFSTTLWDSPDVTFTVGKMRLVIGKFVSKLAIKPTVHVYKDQAELKVQNPKLYEKLAAGRPGDFDTTVAAGYSMGDVVVIFSDRIGSEDHLSFVLAHETLGHFGLRGLMGNASFNSLMTKLYDTDPRLTAAVDAAMAVRGLGKAEAVEEYLSDYAAQLHTSLVRRVWNGLKSVLNHVGIKFGDEATRYLLSQSKRYLKTGEKTGVFSNSSVMHRIWGVENAQVGRFAVAETAHENELVADMIRHTAAIPMNLKDAVRALGDSLTSWDKFKTSFFSLTNFQALRNPGLYEFNRLLDETRQHEQYVYNKYNAKLEKMLFKSEKHRARVSRMLMEGRTVAVYRMLAEPMSLKDRDTKLFKLDPTTGELVGDITAIDDFVSRGILSFEDMRDGVTYTRDIMGKDGVSRKETHKFDGISDLTKEEYDDYVLSRKAVADVELELLKAKYANMMQAENVSTKTIRKFLKNTKVGDEADKLVKRTFNKYKEIYVSGYAVDARGNIEPGVNEMKKADEFLTAVNHALISADDKNDEAVRAFFDKQKDADDFMENLKVFRDNRKLPTADLAFLFQNEVKRIVLEDVNLGVEEERAKRTMVGGYVPVIRDKAWEMRLQAYDKDGNAVKLHEDHKKLLTYSQFAERRSALAAAELIDKQFEGKTFEVWADKGNGEYETVEVTLKAKFGEALTQVASDPALNLDEFMHGLRLFKINLAPDKMSLVIRTLTEAGDQLRKRMAFSNTPGYDKSTGVFALSRHIQLRAATIAKTITRPKMRELMNLNDNEQMAKWRGDASGVFSMYNRWEKETDPTAKQHYRHQLDHKLHMFVETNPEAKGWDGSKAGYDKIKTGLSEESHYKFYNQAEKTLEFLERNQSPSESDFGSGKVASRLRAATSIFQLGGSIAQGAMNMVSPYTNWLPYMASYNARTGFGGGFSLGRTIAAYQTALRQVGVSGLAGPGSTKYNTAEFYDELAANPAAAAKVGLTQIEAEFLAQEIREGKLIPAQSNALLGTARTGTTNRWALRGIDTFMAPFNRTEQASRRAAALAAFRLAYARSKNADMARDFAIQSLDLTLGEYSVLNRPPAWRDGIQSFLYMYKVYPTTTIQLMRRLDKKGQIIMLGTLWMMAGVTGFPFAEDIEDLIDTIAQALGLQMGSVRAEFTKILEDIAPGLSPYVMKGVVNTSLGIPADVASRFSMGDFIPGSGILLAGSTVGEELKEIVGPMPGMAIGTATMARDILSLPFSNTVSLQDTLRASPITIGRMIGDTWAYASNGAVVDRRGYVVAPNATIGQMAFRLMGFYPKAAANQYEAIRIAKRIGNYQKEVVGAYRTAWVQSMMKGNRSYAREIELSVQEWNLGAKGTQLYIDNFRKNSERALKEARKSATQRTLKSTGKAGREDAARLMDILSE